MRYRLFSVLLFFTFKLFANVGFTPVQMQRLYEQVRTPYKYGMAIAPKDNYHKIDCPTVFQNAGVMDQQPVYAERWMPCCAKVVKIDASFGNPEALQFRISLFENLNTLHPKDSTAAVFFSS